MKTRVSFTPQGKYGALADKLVLPIMYVLTGNFREEPRRTNFWNRERLSKEDLAYLSVSLMCEVRGFTGELPNFRHPVFLRGWKNFVVLEAPSINVGSWYIGWVTGDKAYISRIPLAGKVRMLIGPGDVRFFGVNEVGTQVKVFQSGKGIVGFARQYARIPLR